MKLFFQKFGEGKPLVILHGLFGASDNWLTLGKKLADHYTVYLVDQRNHGRSPHSDEMNYDLMAKDLKSFLDTEEIEHPTIIGHSMGGKTAMRFAQLFPERAAAVVVVDMGIKAYPPHHNEVLEALNAVKVETLESRGDAEAQMKPHIADFATRQFLLKSLYRKDRDNFGWRINIPVLEKAMPEIMAALPEGEADIPALFVSGTKSDYLKPEDYPDIKKIFPRADFKELPVGHWVHAEDPDGLETILRNFVTAE